MASAFAQPPEKWVSATFKDGAKLQDASACGKERIAVLGRNFQLVRWGAAGFFLGVVAA